MLCFIHNSMDKVFISTEHNDDPKRLKLNYSNPKNFLSKNEDFYKSWIDTSNLSVNNNENKIDKILKITTQTLTNTDEIKADMKSMM